jgi:hypothetical protein
MTDETINPDNVNPHFKDLDAKAQEKANAGDYQFVPFHSNVCPSCGHCPTCGHGPSYPQYWPNYQPFWYRGSLPVVTCGGTTSGNGTVTFGKIS